MSNKFACHTQGGREQSTKTLQRWQLDKTYSEWIRCCCYVCHRQAPRVWLSFPCRLASTTTSPPQHLPKCRACTRCSSMVLGKQYARTCSPLTRNSRPTPGANIDIMLLLLWFCLCWQNGVCPHGWWISCLKSQLCMMHLRRSKAHLWLHKLSN